MSATLLGLAWRARLRSSSLMLVLVRLVDFADDDGGHIYPSIARVASDTKLSERTVQYVLRELETIGLLKVDKRAGGRGNATAYRIDLDVLRDLGEDEKGATAAPFSERKGATAAPLDPEKGAATAPFPDVKGATDDVKGATDDVKGAAIAPHPLRTTNTPQGVKDTCSFRGSSKGDAKKDTTDSDFASWYQIYPRHRAKGAALKAYERARRSGASVDELLAGARRERERVERGDVELMFVKHPSTWLNARCWEDEPDPPPARAGAAGNGRGQSLYDIAMGPLRDQEDQEGHEAGDVVDLEPAEWSNA